MIANVYIGKGLPVEPTYTKIDKFVRPFIIESRVPYEYIAYSIARDNYITPDQIEAFVADDEEWIFVYGLIKFSDFLGKGHEQGFLFVWLPQQKSFFVPSGPMDYFRQT